MSYVCTTDMNRSPGTMQACKRATSVLEPFDRHLSKRMPSWTAVGGRQVTRVVQKQNLSRVLEDSSKTALCCCTCGTCATHCAVITWHRRHMTPPLPPVRQCHGSTLDPLSQLRRPYSGIDTAVVRRYDFIQQQMCDTKQEK